MLFDAVLRAGTVVEPLVSEMILDHFGWIGVSLLLAGSCLSGVIPVVSFLVSVCVYTCVNSSLKTINIKPRRITETS